MTDLREILNAIFYLNKTGCPWRYLPAARQLITELFSFLHTITKIWADSGYFGPELSDWLWHPIRMPDRDRYKQGFPASTCYLVDGGLKEPLLG